MITEITRKPAVLIVDPDKNFQEIMKDLLIQRMHVHQAYSAEEAMNKCWENDYNLIITEMILPDMNVLEFIQKLKRKLHQTLIVVITYEQSVEAATEAIRLGVIDYIQKPFSIEQIALLTDKYYSLTVNKSPDYDFLDMLSEEKRTFELPTDFDLINPFLNNLIDMIRRFQGFNRRELLSVRLSVYEMLMNAMEHGNLEIDYQEKKRLLDKIPDYQKYLHEKSSKQPYSERKVILSYHFTNDSLQITVKDEGKGFDISSIPDPKDKKNLRGLNGRGIFITRLNMDEIIYSDSGNQVSMKKYITAQPEIN